MNGKELIDAFRQASEPIAKEKIIQPQNVDEDDDLEYYGNIYQLKERFEICWANAEDEETQRQLVTELVAVMMAVAEKPIATAYDAKYKARAIEVISDILTQDVDEEFIEKNIPRKLANCALKLSTRFKIAHYPPDSVESLTREAAKNVLLSAKSLADHIGIELRGPRPPKRDLD